MNKHEATILMGCLLECQTALDRALTFAEQLTIDGEREALSSSIKSVIEELLTEAIMPVVSQHPDLNPYNDQGDN